MLIFFYHFPRDCRGSRWSQGSQGRPIVANRRRLCCGWDDFDKYHDKFKTVRHNFSNRNCIIIGGLRRLGGMGEKWRRRWRWKWKWKWRWRWEMMKGTIGALILPGKGYNMCELPFLFIIELSVGWQTERGRGRERESEREKKVLAVRKKEYGWVAHSMKQKQVPASAWTDCIRGTPRA